MGLGGVCISDTTGYLRPLSALGVRLPCLATPAIGNPVEADLYSPPLCPV